MATTATVGEVRAWAKQQGFQVADRGRLPAEVWDAWASATEDAPVPQQRLSEQPVVAAATAADLEAAQVRITALEQQLVALVERVSSLESRPTQPRRRFARSR
jgi:hypothetical protein